MDDEAVLATEVAAALTDFVNISKFFEATSPNEDIAFIIPKSGMASVDVVVLAGP